jgi:hypothetical protein
MVVVMRSYQGYYTRSHQNSEVKRLWAGIVLGWVTSREVPVLHPFCFISPFIFHFYSSNIIKTTGREGAEINEKEFRTLDTLFVERPVINLP